MGEQSKSHLVFASDLFSFEIKEGSSESCCLCASQRKIFQIRLTTQNQNRLAEFRHQSHYFQCAILGFGCVDSVMALPRSLLRACITADITSLHLLSRERLQELQRWEGRGIETKDLLPSALLDLQNHFSSYPFQQY